MSNSKRNHISENLESTNTSDRGSRSTVDMTTKLLQCVDQPAPGTGEDSIRELAYCKWEASGCPTGDGLEFWVEAEQEVKAAESGEHGT